MMTCRETKGQIIVPKEEKTMAVVKSTWDLVREAIKSGRKDEALKLLEDGLGLAKMQHDSLVSFVGMALNQLAGTGEEALERLFRARYTPMAQEWMSSTPGAKESAERLAKLLESPFSKITITEEPDRYVVTLDPCRSGGVLRKGMSSGAAKVSASGIGTTKKAYPWSWNKRGVSYYCAHGALLFEIIPIEVRGYPISVVQYAEKPEDPCVHYFYKKPELIPEEYFTRVGRTKTIK